MFETIYQWHKSLGCPTQLRCPTCQQLYYGKAAQRLARLNIAVAEVNLLELEVLLVCACFVCVSNHRLWSSCFSVFPRMYSRRTFPHTLLSRNWYAFFHCSHFPIWFVRLPPRTRFLLQPRVQQKVAKTNKAPSVHFHMT